MLYAGMAWVLYLAIEPYVRRRWPQSLIAWTRVLAGRIRDPLVGGHVLVGTAFGVGLAIWFAVRSWTMLQQGAVPIQMRLDVAVLQGAGWAMSAWLENVIVAIAEGHGSVALFLLVRALLRRNWAASIGFTLLATAPFVLMAYRMVTDAAFLIPATALSLWVLIRFDVLSVTVATFVRES
jgi:serine/threonine-protein kinase